MSTNTGTMLNVYGPPVGLPTQNTGAVSIFDSSNSDGILSFTDRGTWDPITRMAFFLGSSHVAGKCCIYYDDATATWGYVEIDTLQILQPAAPSHGYEDCAVDPVGRRLYYWMPQVAGIVYYKNLDNLSAAWAALPTNPVTGYLNYGSICWFPDMGSQGTLLMVSTGLISGWDKASNTWSVVATLQTNSPAQIGDRIGNYGNIMQYDPVNHCVIVGGGNNSNADLDVHINKLTPGGIVTAKDDAPDHFGIMTGIPGSGSVAWIGPRTGVMYVMFAGPTTGRQTFYTFDHTASHGSQWRLITSPVPPAYNDVRGAGSVNYVIGIACSNYGGALICVYRGPNPATGCDVYFFKD